MKHIVLIGMMATLSWAFVGCGASGNKPNVEIIQDMMDQPTVKAQKQDDFFKDGISSLVPPEHTQAVGNRTYPYGVDLARAIAENKNPISSDMSDATLLVGQKMYNTHCMVCHGVKGLGDGGVKPKYPVAIPSLVSDRVKAMPDAHVFHIITMGQGLMGAYASHVPAKYRWQLVNYIRHLQK